MDLGDEHGASLQHAAVDHQKAVVRASIQSDFGAVDGMAAAVLSDFDVEVGRRHYAPGRRH